MADTNLLVLAREYKKLREEVKQVLRMPKGDKGDQGVKGDTGDTGPQGFPGRDGKDGINGYNGIDGSNGKDGQDGQDGLDGVGVQNAYIDFDNSLVIVLTDGREINAGFLSQDTKEAIVATFKQGASTINELTKFNTGISGWSYTEVSKFIGTEETAPTGLFFKPDGLKMYVLGTSGDDVNEYVLSTAWDISTATFTAATNNPFSVAVQDSVPADIFFKPDGLAFYIVGDTNNAIFQYTLTTAWDITTASYASKTFSVATQETTPSGIWFKEDGLKMFVIGSATDAVYQYTLSTEWDIATATYSGVSFSVSAQELGSIGLQFNSSGSQMYVIGSSGDEINLWNLSLAWDITTAVFQEKFYIGFQELTPSAVFVATEAFKVFIIGSSTDTVYAYSTNNNAIKQDSDNILLNGYTRINNNAYIDGSVKIDGGLTLEGSIIASGNIIANQITTSTTAITLGGGITTGNTTVTSTQTTGLITVGGTAGTGAITVGQSTAAQTLNLATGATATATTKTVNIGTAGVSGSTTNINYGSAVSGALGTHIWNIGGEQMRLNSTGLGLGTTPSASAILDAQSTTKGVRMPNMTTTQKNAIASPAAGLIVFDTTLAKLSVYTGVAWQTITSV